MDRSQFTRGLQSVIGVGFLFAFIAWPWFAFCGLIAIVWWEWELTVMAFLISAACLISSVAFFRRFNSSGFPTRFSLRTMLIATTLVAVVLGLGVWAAG